MTAARILVTPYTPDRFGEYFAYIMDPVLQEQLGLQGVTDEASARETFFWLLENRRFYAVVLPSSGTAIGHIALHPVPEDTERELGLAGLHGFSVSLAIGGAYRRCGYAAEALGSLIGTLFRQEKTDYLVYEYLPDNAASCALQRKLGFCHRGIQTFGDVILKTSVLLNRE